MHIDSSLLSLFNAVKKTMPEFPILSSHRGYNKKKEYNLNIVIIYAFLCIYVHGSWGKKRKGKSVCIRDIDEK